MTPRPPFPPDQWQLHIEAAQAWLLHNERLSHLSVLAQEAGYDLAVFGGAIRDLLLFGQLSNDIDCVASSPAESYDETAFIAWGHHVGTQLNLTFMDEGRPHHWLVVDAEANFALDVTWCHDFDVFLKQTDYTMNGIGYSLTRQAWLDPNNGLTDLCQRQLVIPAERNTVNRWARVLMLMVHTNSQSTPALTDWLMAHRDELAATTNHDPIGNLLKLFRAFSYAGWGAPYITSFLAQTGLLTVIFVELIPWIGPHTSGLLSLLERWTQTTAHWDALTPEQQAWMQQPYPEHPGMTMLGMIRLAQLMHCVFNDPERTPLNVSERITVVDTMIQRLGLHVDPFPTLMTQAVTLCAVAQPDHAFSTQWLSQHTTDFLQDYHQSLSELLAHPY